MNPQPPQKNPNSLDSHNAQAFNEIAKRNLNADVLLQIDSLCIEFEERKNESPGFIESLLAQLPPDQEIQSRAITEMLRLEWRWLELRGVKPDLEHYLQRFPNARSALQVAHHQWVFNATSKAPGSRELFHAGDDDSNEAPLSQSEDLVQWIQRYQISLAHDATLEPTEWMSQQEKGKRPSPNVIAGMEFLQNCAVGKDLGKQVGDFRILREIGRGGMGVVYQAEQLSLGRTVALKILWFGSVSDPEAIRRFQREASTVAKLHHTNIVPVFSVGSDGPINYYAMQFIEGRSLDRALKENAGPIEWQKVADWGLQASEALEHAHRRGVIHRDVKPSNLILDFDGRIWLTDFGLAKRSDDATLSLAGALLGTPRYMSPEQASASILPVDHRSDLYSLGASLYELVTGKPVFDADTPHAILSQILSKNPVPANQRMQGLPRDLNTILTKCLSKQASDRYETALDLANDLRALLDGRPIRAKRANWVDEGKAWMRKNRKELGLSLRSIASTAAVFLLVTLCWFGWKHLREASLSIESPIAPVIVTLVDAQEEMVVRPITIPTQEPIAVAPGSYKLRASSEGFLSQDYSVDLHVKQDRKVQLELDDQSLFKLDRLACIATVGSRTELGAHLVGLDSQGFLIRRERIGNAHTIRIPWSAFIIPNKTPGLTNVLELIPQMDQVGDFDIRPWVYPFRSDWNNDSKEEYLIAMRHQAGVALVSENGEVIWSIGLAPDVTESLENTSKTKGEPRGTRSSILEMPIQVGDLNGDQAPDCIVHVASLEPWGILNLSSPVREIAALSGKTGEVLWRYQLDSNLFTQSTPPSDYRWYVAKFSGSNGSSSSSSFLVQGQWKRDGETRLERHGDLIEVGALFPPASEQDRTLLFQVDDKLLQIDVTTGKEISPIQTIPAHSFQRCTLAELDGKAGRELLLIENLHGTSNPISNDPSEYQNAMKIVAWSVADNRTLWEKIISVRPANVRNWWQQSPNWPMVCDFDNDGKQDVVVPVDSWLPESYLAGGAMAVVHGSSGEQKWRVSIPSADTQIDHFISVPDLDQDGFQELVAVTMAGLPMRVYADCFSGKDGKKLWTFFESVGMGNDANLEFLSRPWVWHCREDGLPQLVIPLFSSKNRIQDTGDALFVSIRTGKLIHRLHGFHQMEARDLDGDDVEDLMLSHYRDPMKGMNGEMDVRVIQGSSPQVWLNLGGNRIRVPDLNSDGWEDLVAVESDSISAYSTFDGKELWTCGIDSLVSKSFIEHGLSDLSNEPSGRSETDRLKYWDFDHDGTMDLILHHELGGPLIQPLEAISGKTGRRLWRAAEFCRSVKTGKIVCDDVDRDGQPELLWYGFRDTIIEKRGKRSSYSTNDGNLMVSVFSTRDGSLKWQKVLGREYGSVSNLYSTYDLGPSDFPNVIRMDWDGNGVNDYLLFGEATASPQSNQLRGELIALDGISGKELWKRPCAPPSNPQKFLLESARTTIARNEQGRDVLVVLDSKRDPSVSTEDSMQLTWIDPSDRNENVVQSVLWNSSDDAFARNRRMILQPLTLRRAVGGDWVAVQCRTENQRQICVFRNHGEIHAKYPITVKTNFSSGALPLSIDDCNEDGNDEIIVANDGLEVLSVGEEIRALYSIEISRDDSGTSDVHFHHGTGDDADQIVVTQWEKFPFAEGFHARNGRRIWRCNGPTRERAYYGESPGVQIVWNGLEADSFPFIVFNKNEQMNCRFPEPRKGIQESFGANHLNNAQFELTRFDLHSQLPIAQAADPRYARGLPWMSNSTAIYWTLEWRRNLPPIICESIFLFLLPGWYILTTFRNRRFRLAWWMLFPVIAAIFVLTLTGRLSPISRSVPERLAFAFYFAPLVATSIAVPVYLWERRWRFLLLLLILVAGFGLVSGFSSLIGDLRSRPLTANEYLVFDGWYWVLLDGYFATSFCYCLLLRWWLKDWK